MYKKLPLVSVIVITYNSSKTIKETLESIKNQTYKDIELIISDDCSKDDTVKVCETWINENVCRFSRCEIVTSEKNTGIAANCNRGYYKAQGEWVKEIAGDDVLMDRCIEINVNFITDYPKTEILLSKVKPIGDKHIINKHPNLFNYTILKLKNKELFHLLLISNFLPSSTLFISKNIHEELGGYDESIPLLEDHPFWIKALYKGKKISFNNEFTVFYRMSEGSISLSTKLNPLYIQSLNVFNIKLSEYRWNYNKLFWFYYKNIEWRQGKPFILKAFSKFLDYLNPMRYYTNYLFSKANKFRL